MTTSPLPWAPLLTTRRADVPELTLHGVVCVVTGQDRLLLNVGDSRAPLWGRSLLKPWQLWGNLEAIRSVYRGLQPEHLAMMVASHNGERVHLGRLQGLLKLAEVTEAHLQCPACYPMHAEDAAACRANDKPRQRLYHPCSGKHIGQIMALRGHQKDPQAPWEEYPVAAVLTEALKTCLAELLHEPMDALPQTMDGCGMQQVALPALSLARLFQNLAQPRQAIGQEISEAMAKNPVLVGGTDRLDTRLMDNSFATRLPKSVRIVAKEGADGLLGVGIAPSNIYGDGLGLLIKVASGYNAQHLEQVLTAVLVQLGLKDPPPKPEAPLSFQSHF